MLRLWEFDEAIDFLCDFRSKLREEVETLRKMKEVYTVYMAEDAVAMNAYSELTAALNRIEMVLYEELEELLSNLKKERENSIPGVPPDNKL